MLRTTTPPQNADYARLAMRSCPLCEGPVYRIRRRWIDRVMSLFSTRLRYRCRSFSCRWEGNLRPEKSMPVLRNDPPAA